MDNVKTSGIFSIFLMSLVVACSGSDLPCQAFSQQDSLSDFSLNDNYQYWKIKIGHPDDSATNEVIYSYNTDSCATLPQTAKDNLVTADPQGGFSELE